MSAVVVVLMVVVVVVVVVVVIVAVVAVVAVVAEVVVVVVVVVGLLGVAIAVVISHMIVERIDNSVYHRCTRTQCGGAHSLLNGPLLPSETWAVDV